ncbi:nad kinase [Anaeramoeba ignava]|uniref:Nad kinase n=1 Tax=Anaeramoeba ignava TaxID=1746090 RepID=A0A9Q0LWJ7_ANAIG|nr:nad kinase [Anaeramoeba ignava]
MKPLKNKNQQKFQFKYMSPHIKSPKQVEYSITRSLSYTTTPLKEIIANYSEISQSNLCKKSFRFEWKKEPKNVLIIKKWKDEKTTKMAIELINYLKKLHLIVYIEPSTSNELKEGIPFTETQKSNLNELIDLLIIIGGDGTVLHACTLFPQQELPLLLAFHYGTLAFFSVFDFKEYPKQIKTVLKGNFEVTVRARLLGQVYSEEKKLKTEYECLNEFVISRDGPWLSRLDCYCDDTFFTTIQADGIIISAPSGSTAYSKSAGGPMVCPNVPGILFTPICAHSLSNRPLVFPDCAVITIHIPNTSRSESAIISVDAKKQGKLLRGDYIVITTHKFSLPCVNKINTNTDWVTGISAILHWNNLISQPDLQFRSFDHFENIENSSDLDSDDHLGSDDGRNEDLD